MPVRARPSHSGRDLAIPGETMPVRASRPGACQSGRDHASPGVPTRSMPFRARPSHSG